MLENKLLLNQAQKQIILGVYMPLIFSKYGNINLEIAVEKLKFEFNFQANTRDLQDYYKSLIELEIEDLHLTLKHVGVNYG